MKQTYLIALLLLSSLVLLFGYDNQPDVIVEEHEITNIEEGIIRGENLTGFGEGIYYTIEQFEEMGITEIAVGDVVSIGWTEYSFDNNEWDKIALLELAK
jgi:hypothetical protein